MSRQVALIEKGDVAGGAEVNRLEVKDNATRVFTLLAGMKQDLETTAATRFVEQQAAARTTRVVAIGMVVLIAAVAAIIGYWVVRNLLAQLGGEPDYAAAVVGKIAAGNLCADIEVRDGDRSSLLFAMASMRDSLARVIGEVHGGTSTISSAARQIASGNADLSARTEQQASALEETASSLDELTSTVAQNADNARQANQLAVTASEVAAQGGAVVAEVVDTMGAINESARKIVDIISVIDGIAFQTNILALNAAVEAARAGEQGRGFAVVAAEVRNLAQRSANAAKEIKILIDDSVKKVDTGSKLVYRAGATMGEVVGAIRRVTDIMGEISTASQEQKAGIEQVGKAIAQMDHATQQNAALVEETAAGSESLRELADNLAHAVGMFKIEGTRPAPARPKPAPAVRTKALASADREEV
ncbi:methyl-accepting chemotaxis protein [Massilia sp. TW-1]|uniref:Methyl-accepting chemotaxis protein n=2 Tax=Telluria antibiotica TaxID=2717319 RepID=A0ABX0PKL8_9BURK|nr:methyl-accepting chemotaxis protein [Telluria antibiotica]